MPKIKDILQEAIEHHRAGRLRLAETRYKDVLTTIPEAPNALYGLGVLRQQTGRPAQAIEYFQRVLRQNPEDAAVLRALGRAAMEISHNDLAVETYERAVALKPHDAALHCELGSALLAAGHYQRALETFDAVLLSEPMHGGALSGKAMALMQLDDARAALDVLEPALELELPDDRVISMYARITRYGGRPERAIELLERAERRTDLHGPRRSEVHFALGELYDNQKRIDDAFAQFRKAHAAAHGNWDMQNHEDHIANLIEAYAGSRMHTLGRASTRSPLPVFIVGMPRSGTSLVEQIIDRHSLAHGAGERTALRSLVRQVNTDVKADAPYPARIDLFTPAAMDHYAKRYLQELAALAPEAERICDKMPGNILLLGFVEQLLPGARVIHCVRDPMDTCFSVYTTNFTTGHPYRHDMQHLAHFLCSQMRLMRHWRQVLNIPILEVRYETLVSDFESQAERIIDFLGLDFEEACLRFYESDREVRTASRYQVRKPIYSSSIGRHKAYLHHLGSLRQALIEGGAMDDAT